MNTARTALSGIIAPLGVGPDGVEGAAILSIGERADASLAASALAMAA